MNAIRRLVDFILALFKNREVVLELTKRDFRARYIGSYLGIVWAFIHPLVTTLLLWFIFEVGFRTGEVAGVPFILWLLCGLVPWYFFSDALANATNSIIENSYLVKKIVFRLSILPVVKILSSLVIHCFFLCLAIIIFYFHGYPLSIHIIQIPIILLFLGIFILGVSLATSSIIVFVKDLGQLIQTILQFGFWFTPIFWPLSMIPEKYQLYLKLNPMYFVVQGYRCALIEHTWVTVHPILTLYFITVSLGSFIIGALIFIRLRPHFADVI